MKSLPTGALVVLLAIAAAGRLSAQYQRQPGDTLRYREVLRTYITVESPQGTIPLTVLRIVILAICAGVAPRWRDLSVTRANEMPARNKNSGAGSDPPNCDHMKKVVLRAGGASQES